GPCRRAQLLVAMGAAEFPPPLMWTYRMRAAVLADSGQRARSPPLSANTDRPISHILWGETHACQPVTRSRRTPGRAGPGRYAVGDGVHLDHRADGGGAGRPVGCPVAGHRPGPAGGRPRR